MPDWNQQEFLSMLECLVNIDSGSEDHEGIIHIANFLEKHFEKIGYTHKKVEFAGKVGCCLELKNFEGDDIDLLLLGHMDTVFPKGTAEKRPFRIQNEYAYGPGVADMKAGLISIYFLARQIYLEKRSIHICIALNGSEETGSTYSNQWIQELGKRSKYCLDFEPGRSGNKFVKERKGFAEYCIKFHGRAAHAGVEPEKGANAIVEMARWITELSSMNDYKNGLSINVGIVQGGQVTNVVPDYAECQLEIRYMDFEKFQAVQNKMEKLQKNSVNARISSETILKSGCPPMLANEKSKRMILYLKGLCNSAKIPVDFIRTGGTSDANFVASSGTPVLDACGPIGGNTHTENEYLILSSIVQRLELIYQLISNLFSN